MTPDSPQAGAELGTLLHLLRPADRGPERRPLAVLPWAPAGGGPQVLVRQVAHRVGLSVLVGLLSLTSRRRPVVIQPTRGSLAPGTRDRLRRTAGRGLVAVLPEAGPSLLDRVLSDSGTALESALGVGADGAVRALVDRRGTRSLLRMGLAGSAADPSNAAAGLRALSDARVAHVPELLGEGSRGGVVWTLEAALPGSRPRRVSPLLADRIAAFTAALPRANERADVSADADVIASAVPSCAAGVHLLADEVRLSALIGEAQLRHGDLWLGNVLTRNDHLTGIVDWDAWSRTGLPAVDLLHLLATEERLRSRSALGSVWLRRPWDAPPFVDLVRRHWPEWGDDGSARAAVGGAWWLGQLAADIRRSPALAADPTWVSLNVRAVTAARSSSPQGPGAHRP